MIYGRLYGYLMMYGRLYDYLLIKRVSEVSKNKGRQLKLRVRLNGAVYELTSRQRFNGNAKVVNSE